MDRPAAPDRRSDYVVSGHDERRLGDRRLHGAARHLRLRPGLHRRRAVAGSGSRSARSSGPGWPRCCSTRDRARPYAPLFGLLGALLAGGVMASGLEGLGARVRAAMRMPGPAGRRWAARGGADRVRGPRHGLGRRAPSRSSRRARSRCARTSSARRSSRAQSAAAALGADPRRAGPDRSAALGARPGGRRVRPHAPDPRQPGRRGRPPQRGPRVRNRLRPRRRGQRLGGGPGPGGHQRPRRGRRDRHGGPGPRGRAGIARRLSSPSMSMMIWPFCACRAWHWPALPMAARTRTRHPGGDPRLSARRPV